MTFGFSTRASSPPADQDHAPNSMNIQVTFNEGGFDAFPMQSRDGAQLVWGSSRNGASPADLNLFLARWVA